MEAVIDLNVLAPERGEGFRDHLRGLGDLPPVASRWKIVAVAVAGMGVSTRAAPASIEIVQSRVRS